MLKVDYLPKITAKPSKYPQGRFNNKNCKWCEKEFSPLAPSQHYCSEHCRKDGRRDTYYRNVYGIGLKECKAMLDKQGDVCAICKQSGFKMHKNKEHGLNLDHCHNTGKIRGWLCDNCNRALGLFKDNVEVMKTAIEYLERATTIPKGSTLQADGSGSGEPLEIE